VRIFPKVIREAHKFRYYKMLLDMCERNQKILENFTKIPERYKTLKRLEKAKALEKWNNSLLEIVLFSSKGKLAMYFRGEILVLKMSFSTLAHELAHHFIFLFHLPPYFHHLLDRLDKMF